MYYPELPLKGNFDETKYRIYFADSGLLVAMLDEEAQEDLRANRNMGVYKGALYENVVGEAVGGRAKSLRTLIAGEKYEDIRYGIKFTGGNIGYDNHVYTFPYFCAFLLKRYLKGVRN